MKMVEWMEWIFKVVDFLANSVTLVLGLVALWALVFHRKKILLAVKVLLTTFMSERIKRLRETLGKLDSLSYDNKGDRREIIALLGQVSGQIKTFATGSDDILAIQKEINEIHESNRPLSEATKRRIIHELHGYLDTVSFTETMKILE